MAGSIRWGLDPFKETERDMRDLTDRFTRLLSRLPSRVSAVREALTVADWSPTVDIAETESEYLVKCELPEVDRNDVKVSVQGHVLTIQGERRHEKEEKGKRFHRVERSYGTFLRTFEIPDAVDEEKVKAEFKDGMLLVHLPKMEKEKGKAIEINVE